MPESVRLQVQVRWTGLLSRGLSEPSTLDGSFVSVAPSVKGARSASLGICRASCLDCLDLRNNAE